MDRTGKTRNTIWIERTKRDAFDLLQTALDKSEDKDEQDRVQEEITLFKERGWVEYIPILVKLIRTYKSLSDIMPVWMNLSALDSYVLYKICKSEVVGKRLKWSKDTRMLEDERSKVILFNDALRLSINVRNIVSNSHLLRRNEELRRPLDEILLDSGLNYEILEIDRSDLSITQLVVVSTGDIPKKDIDVILNEKKESSKEETDILRKYLILNFEVRLGI